ncbi:hypothetical protein Tco_1472259 [Tanacetum coccineum]
MIRKLIMNGVISIEFGRSQQNFVDHLTKRLAKDLVTKSTKGMRLKIAGNLVQLWVQFILGNGTGGTNVTEHPDSDSGKREFVSLMKFSEFTLQTSSGSNPSEDLSSSEG